MDERSFLNWMFEKYNLSDFSVENQAPRYINGLSMNIDFYKMREYIDIHCKSMPTALEINAIARNHNFYNGARSPLLEHIHAIKNTPKINFKTDISPEFRQKLLDFHRKYGIKTKIKELQNER